MGQPLDREPAAFGRDPARQADDIDGRRSSRFIAQTSEQGALENVDAGNLVSFRELERERRGRGAPEVLERRDPIREHGAGRAEELTGLAGAKIDAEHLRALVRARLADDAHRADHGCADAGAAAPATVDAARAVEIEDQRYVTVGEQRRRERIAVAE